MLTTPEQIADWKEARNALMTLGMFEQAEQIDFGIRMAENPGLWQEALDYMYAEYKKRKGFE